MSAIKLSTPSSGSISLSPADTASNLTITVPAVTGTMAIQGAAFSAYLSGNQTLTTQTFVKITCQTEEFDTASCYDNSTNYRFTPNVAGYYQVDANIYFNADTRGIVAIYKNGSQFKNGADVAATNLRGLGVSCLVYMNGSTDYIELYGWTQGTTIIGGQAYQTYFQASMVRGA
jgi:hypothetical protein